MIRIIHVHIFSLQQFPQLVHHVGFMLHKRVGVAVQSNCRVLVSEDLGERFYIHTAFDGAGGECMPQGMKALVRYF